MKTFTLGLEFTDGNFDTRTVKANTLDEAKVGVTTQNKRQLENKAMFPSAREIVSIEVQ